MKYNKKNMVFLPMRSLLFIAAFYFCSLITKRDLTEITHWWTIIASAINVVTIIVLWIIFKQSNTAPPDNGIYKYSMTEFTGGLPLYLYTKSNIQRTKVQRTKVQRTKVLGKDKGTHFRDDRGRTMPFRGNDKRPVP